MGKFLSPPSLEYETKCAIIYYPADDGNFFLNAVRGQLSLLSKPYIWEVDDPQKAKSISQIFIDHELMTDGVFFRLSCDEIPYIVGDMPIEINVTVNDNNVGSGGCCGNIYNTWLLPPDWDGGDYFPPTTPPDDNSTPHQGTATYQCQAAHTAIDQIKQIIDTFVDATLEQSPYTWLYEALSNIIAFLGSAGEIYGIITTLLGSDYAGFTDECQALIEKYRTELVCAIISAPSAEDAKAAMVAVVNGATEYNFAVRYWVSLIIDVTNIDALFAGTFVPDPVHEFESCNCGLTDDWYLMPTALGASHTMKVDSYSPASFRMYGTMTRPYNTGYACQARNDGLYYSAFQAVTFDITYSGGVQVGSGLNVYAGPTGNGTQIPVPADGEVYHCLFHKNGFTDFDAGDYDIVIAEKATPDPGIYVQFTLSATGYRLPDTNVDLLIENIAEYTPPAQQTVWTHNVGWSNIVINNQNDFLDVITGDLGASSYSEVNGTGFPINLPAVNWIRFTIDWTSSIHTRNDVTYFFTGMGSVNIVGTNFVDPEQFVLYVTGTTPPSGNKFSPVSRTQFDAFNQFRNQATDSGTETGTQMSISVETGV